MIGVTIASIAIGAALLTMAVQRRSRLLQGLARGLLITYSTIVLLYLGAEAYFRFIYADSENTPTLATLNWLERYWQTNSLGYRDREWAPEDYADKITVVVTGDSFTAGWGIMNPADRYTDVLASALGDGYALFNLGIYGTATPEQLDRLRAYPVSQPDVVILQYFLNDINYTMLSQGVLPQAEPTPAWAAEGYFFNFLYNRILARWLNPEFNRDWWAENYRAYDSAPLWDAHRAEIEAYISHVESVGARLIVVIFPNMLDPVRSIPYVDRVAQVFEGRGHNDILKLFDAAAAWPPQERMVSPRDTHPSVAFHEWVGQTMANQFFSTPG